MAADRGKADALVGRPLADPEVRRLLGEKCEKQGKPLDNVPSEAAFRRKVLPVHARRALDEILAAGWPDR